MNQESYQDEPHVRPLDAQELTQVEGGSKPVSEKGQCFNGCIPVNKFGPCIPLKVPGPQ